MLVDLFHEIFTFVIDYIIKMYDDMHNTADDDLPMVNAIGRGTKRKGNRIVYCQTKLVTHTTRTTSLCNFSCVHYLKRAFV